MLAESIKSPSMAPAALPTQSKKTPYQLLARNIPFAFATGYSDGSMLPEHLRAVPRLSKPYALEDVRRLLRSLVARELPQARLPPA